MPVFQFTLKDFAFPTGLDEARSTFRFLISLRYVNSDDKFETVQAVLPGLDSYWECEKSHKGKANYVRDGNLPKFDMQKIDLWDTLLFRLKAKELHSLQIKVIDIEKTGGWLDKIKDYVGSLVQAYLGSAKATISGGVATPGGFLEKRFGTCGRRCGFFDSCKTCGHERPRIHAIQKKPCSVPRGAGWSHIIEGGRRTGYI